MSIYERLSEAEEQGTIIRYRRAPIEEKRALYVTASFFRELSHPGSAIDFFGQKFSVSALFTRWLNGSPLSIRLHDRAFQAELARLEPPPEEIWEMRITVPRPQLRVFGRFAERDVFVAMFAINRDRLGRAFSANGRKNQSWQGAMYECEAIWNGILGGAEPFRGQSASDYVS